MGAKEIAKKALIVASVAFAVAGWWFVRNAIIYDGDILGTKTQNEYGDKYALEQYKPSVRKTPENSNESIWHMLDEDAWANTTAKSFVGIFGYHSILMSNKIYYSYLGLWLIGGLGCLLKFKDLFIYKKEEKSKYILNYIFVIAIIIPILLSIIYSYTSDFQPQGRYIMGIIIPFVYFVVNGIQTMLEKFIKSEKIRNIIIIMVMLLIIAISFKAIFSYVRPAYN